jgi:hypothetical protein
LKQVDSEAAAAIQPELGAGEVVVWAGRPSLQRIFHKQDVFLIPFSLIWGIFAIVWEAEVAGFWGEHSGSGAPLAFVLWGIPFVLIGQYLIWGRFLNAAWKKKRTFYAVTNQRVLAVQNGWSRITASAYLDTLPALVKETSFGKTGSLRFAAGESSWLSLFGWKIWDNMSIGANPEFLDLEDVHGVYQIISELRSNISWRN